MIQNSSGKIYYGMHFYPGLAQYDQPSKDSFKIFLNEDVLRKMDPTFAGKPIFVEHVDEVDSNIDQLRKEADGWVVESFFNGADGKHWVKMILVSEKAERAIKNGYRLSNAYVPRLNGKSGVWNGIDYQNEVIEGEYEHLAIVKSPRYDESIVMTPDEFKTYNENLKIELNRISNSKPEEKKSMLSKLKFWNKKEVENSLNLENISVTLPKSGMEFSIFQIVNAMDEMEMKKKEKMENKDMDVESELEIKKKKMDVEGDLHNEDSEDQDIEYAKKEKEVKNKKMKNKEKEEVEDCMENEEEEKEEKDKKAKKKALELAEHEEEEIKEEEVEKKKNKKMKNENFTKLQNAHLISQETRQNTYYDQVSRGKAKYGSGN